MPRMLTWLRPAYPPEGALSENEGTIKIGLIIPAAGPAYGLAIERCSGSDRLDVAAMQVAKAWRLAPARWQGRPIDSTITFELRFRFFEYSWSGLDDETSPGAVERPPRPIGSSNRRLTELYRVQHGDKAALLGSHRRPTGQHLGIQGGSD